MFFTRNFSIVALENFQSLQMPNLMPPNTKSDTTDIKFYSSVKLGVINSHIYYQPQKSGNLQVKPAAKIFKAVCIGCLIYYSLMYRLQHTVKSSPVCQFRKHTQYPSSFCIRTGIQIKLKAVLASCHNKSHYYVVNMILMQYVAVVLSNFWSSSPYKQLCVTIT